MLPRYLMAPRLQCRMGGTDYGETRFNTMGLLGVAVLVICHTESESEIRIISMRKAEQNETELFFSCAL